MQHVDAIMAEVEANPGQLAGLPPAALREIVTTAYQMRGGEDVSFLFKQVHVLQATMRQDELIRINEEIVRIELETRKLQQSTDEIVQLVQTALAAAQKITDAVEALPHVSDTDRAKHIATCLAIMGEYHQAEMALLAKSA